ncbi:unnamed protein product [Rhizoctonia solani]|uniref:F-box domain-containing protein n=1 Tax=Rhizoctonia solani TaxID=456999 RepID=A0A8H3DLX5_9AGAM|nr:unnamed protein product [Rhizoctonia solani]
MNENMRPVLLAKRIDEALDVSHCLLDHQLVHSRSALAQARNTLLSQACRLPDEVYYEIFINVLYPADKASLSDSMDPALRKIFSTLYSLMSVCRVWWDVILKRSEFWSLIPLYIGEPSHCSLAPTLSAQRARGPMHLAAIVYNPSLIRERLDISTIPIHRIRTINISSFDNSVERAISQVLLEFVGHNFSSLELREISLYQMDNSIDDIWIPNDFDLAIDKDSPIWGHFLEILKLLSVFRVHGAELRWNQIAFSDRLVELRLQEVILGHDSGLADFLRKLVWSPALRDLKIITVKTFSDELKTDQRVLLPNLDSLLLEDLSYNTLRTVLCTISPGSHRLTLFPTPTSKQIVSLGNPNPETITIEQLSSILEPVPIDTMLLRGYMDQYGDQKPAEERWLTGPELHTLLTSMPALKTLKTNTWAYAKEEWQAMTRSENERFPKLEHLDFSRAFVRDEEFIKSFVASHPIRRMTLEGLRCIDADDGVPCYDFMDGEEDIVDWLTDNAAGFVLVAHDLDGKERREPMEFCSYVWRLW